MAILKKLKKPDLMLNRKHLRAKAFQVLFSSVSSESFTKDAAVKLHHFYINKIEEAYLKALQLLVDVCWFEDVYISEQKSKRINAKSDIPALFTEFPLVMAIMHDTDFLKLTNKSNATWLGDKTLLRTIYLSLIAAEIDTKNLILVFRHLFKIPAVQQVFEDDFLNWDMDKPLVKDLVERTIKQHDTEGNKKILLSMSMNWPEDSAFAEDLIKDVIKHNDRIEALLHPKYKNWDSDRIATSDTVILKMAVAEMLYCDSIPVKVTINEYIEIAKTYSTPKSNVFVNGVLDVLSKELLESKEIVKRGRGLDVM